MIVINTEIIMTQCDKCKDFTSMPMNRFVPGQHCLNDWCQGVMHRRKENEERIRLNLIACANDQTTPILPFAAPAVPAPSPGIQAKKKKPKRKKSGGAWSRCCDCGGLVKIPDDPRGLACRHCGAPLSWSNRT